MTIMSTMKNLLLPIMSVLGSFIINSLGGWDKQLQTLTVLIIADVLTGIAIAAFLKKSGNSNRGAYDTEIAFNSGFKKLLIYVMVALGVLLDDLFYEALGVSQFIRTSVVLYYCGTEGASLVENLGIMGVPLPQVIVDAFDKLRSKGEMPDD